VKALIVSLNGQRICTAGVTGEELVTVCVTQFGSPGPEGIGTTHLAVTGIKDNHHVEWAMVEMKLGDVFTVQAAETETVDQPTRVGPSAR
jgi:hypothetical protein